MKYVNYLLLFSLLGITALAHGMENDPDGFRGIAWGSRPNLSHMSLFLEMDENRKTYIRNDDKSSIGGAKDLDIYYSFYKDQFYRAGIMSKEFDNNSALFSALRKKFGDPDHSDDGAKKYRWEGEKAIILFTCTAIDGECVATIDSRRLLQLQAEDKAAAAEAGVEDF